MAKTEQDYLLELWQKNICLNCGKAIPEGTRVGSGKKSEGGFCSLDCYGSYYRPELGVAWEENRGVGCATSKLIELGGS
jgi:hypothetical protein